MAGSSLVIERVIAHPLRAPLPKPQRTSQAEYASIELLVVEVVTRDGLVGWGEGLARRGVRGYAHLVDEVLAPAVLGRDAHDRRALWKAMRAPLTGRPGGQVIEAIAAVDIALWDLAGKAVNQPISRLLGGMGRSTVQAYASSINWLDDDAVRDEVAAALACGFTQIKVKLGLPVAAAVARASLVRGLAGDAIELFVDANCIYDVHEAIIIGRALVDLGYTLFEEPIRPDDRAGYAILARQLPIRLAAGEGDFVASEALQMIADRSIGLVQPDVARAGGITETWRIAELAAAHGVGYAPHVGWSGAICAAASLHLAAAAEACRTTECMVCANPLRDQLATVPVGEKELLRGGCLPVPAGPGLGIEINRAALAEFHLG